MNACVVNTSGSTQRGSVGQEEPVLLWVLQTLLQVWLSEQQQQRFPLGV